MEPIKLFDQDNVTVLLHNLYFDKEVDGVRASVEIQNRKGLCAKIEITDLWDGERFYDDWYHTLCAASPRRTEKEEMLELSSERDDDRMLMISNGYGPAFSFRLALFTHRKDGDVISFCSKGPRIVVSKFSMDGVTVMPPEQYSIESEEGTIFASAKHYIPFEINKTDGEKAQQIQAFEDELTQRIKSVEMAPWDVLVAKYGETGKSRFYDIENMCIYNLGTSTFSGCCPTDIAFEELSAEEIDKFQRRFGAKADQNCFYAYTPVYKDELEIDCITRRLIAGWNHVSIDTELPNTPYRYWASIRQQYKHVYVHQGMRNPETDCFGIRVTVHLPQRVLPTSVMKPMLDGIVCAFHQKDGIDEVLRSITGENFEKMIVEAESSLAVLGKKDYVMPYRGKGIKWNPADERLKFAWVSVVTEDCEPYFEGKLFAWD